MRKTDRLRAGCVSCARILTSKLGLLAVVLLAIGILGGFPIVDYLAGRSALSMALTSAWHNIIALPENPIARVLAVLSALWLLGVAAGRIIKADEFRASQSAQNAAEIERKSEVYLDRVFRFLQNFVTREQMRAEIERAKERIDKLEVVIDDYEQDLRYWSERQVQGNHNRAKPVPISGLYSHISHSSFRFIHMPNIQSPPKAPDAIWDQEKIDDYSSKWIYDPDKNPKFRKGLRSIIDTHRSNIANFKEAVAAAERRLATLHQEIQQGVR